MPSSTDNAGNGPEGSSSVRGAVAAPTVSLPKGGGAIRGIGEKFTANPVTGTGSMTVPIATSPGRSGFGPQLSLSYDSGAGNGPFGFGWNLQFPAITRKTDKGLPQYLDADDSDVFILSGAEDLVPVFKRDGSGNWKSDSQGNLIIFEDDRLDGTYRVRRYRPRIEGLFARIERWTNRSNGEIHWRSISRDNVTTLYGKTAESRIADPSDTFGRIFSWLISASYDDKGNAILYEYANENSDGIENTAAHEANRVDRSANRYLKRIKYGNREPNRDQGNWEPIDPALLPSTSWMFEVVFDYGEGHLEELPPDPAQAPGAQHRFVTARAEAPSGTWPVRLDPFSTYKQCFEVRTYRLCRRVLMFHHFSDELDKDVPNELGHTGYLVRSTDFKYAEGRVASFITSATQSGYVRPDTNQPNRYLRKSLPSLDFQYTEAVVHDEVREIDPTSIENIPCGLNGSSYQWVDLDGEGISGVLTEQAGAWFYKRNLSPSPQNLVRENGYDRIEPSFAPVELVAAQPSFALAGGAQFMDLAGDGRPDLVQFDGPVRGFYERSDDSDWEPFRPFVSWPNVDTHDSNLKFVDLSGDGHSDILITEQETLTWYPSIAEGGFGPGHRVSKEGDEENGPALVFSDGTQSAYLADMSGDGLTDLVRIRNGEVCYWPNLGYGRFGAKVTMDHSPWFDAPDQFDQKRVRIADIDGSGNTDIIYLASDGPRLYFNQSGNRWSEPQRLAQFPPIDNVANVTAVDLLGNGTACLVWSSPLPGNGRAPMRYVDLMGGEKPHLLVAAANNLGAETRVRYAPSTRFYLEDKEAGNSWITRLPFPVHVVERVETYDRVSGNRFVTRYAYHHGYFDGEEREFRGFGMVEQWDTEEIGKILEDANSLQAANLDAASFVPPILTRTWFHTGAYVDDEKISRHLAAEYYGAPHQSDMVNFGLFLDTLLDDTVLPLTLTPDEEREACRSLKGSMLRQEVYGLDGTDKKNHPYTVTEQNFTVEPVQPRRSNRHAVFFTHAREVLSYYYERNPEDPRVEHALTLDVDAYGNVLKSVAVGYGRKTSPLAEQLDQQRQVQTLVTYTENDVTVAVDDWPHLDDYRAPLPSETRTYELHADTASGGYCPSGTNGYFQISDFVNVEGGEAELISDVPGEVNYEASLSQGKTRRLIDRVRILYRDDQLNRLLSFRELQPLALPGETYRLAFTPGLLGQVYKRELGAAPEENLLPDPASLLGGKGPGNGGYVQLDAISGWWIPSGRVTYSKSADIDNPALTATNERFDARKHFFLPRKFTDPFSQSTTVDYDTYDLHVVKTVNAVQNSVTALYDYRVLQPMLVTDPNGNRSEARFDALGLVVGTAIRGKATGSVEGDSFDDFVADLTAQQLFDYVGASNPRSLAAGHLGTATSRIIYDLDRIPACAASIARETHASALAQGQEPKVQIRFVYSDGFGREVQAKIPAEPGRLDTDDSSSPWLDPRWVGSRAKVYNNKGKPVRQYEPFFSPTHAFGVEQHGVSSTLFYDPAERVVATLHANHSWEKVVFDAWQQTTYDVNDTVINADGTTDPRCDPHVKGFFSRLPDADYLPTWYEERVALTLTEPERDAAEKSAVHRQTPSVTHLDTLGRTFLTVAHNRFERDGAIIEELYPSRVELDIEGNQRIVRDAVVQNGDAQGRIVMRYDYDMLGNRIHQTSMEAGERWMLNDAAGKPLRRWDSRGHGFRMEYDPLRRPLRSYVIGAVAENPALEILTERLVYGEQHQDSLLLNLRGKVFFHLDQAGRMGNDAYDFKGNLLRASRRLAKEYRSAVDWRSIDEYLASLLSNPTAAIDPDVLEAALDSWLELETFSSSTTYDALNRTVQSIAPHGNQPGTTLNVSQPEYNEANLLESLHVWLERPAAPSGLIDRKTELPSLAGVDNIDYDAKGQRLAIQYKNGAATWYAYDPKSFRLRHLYTRRGVAFGDDCETPPPPPALPIAAPEQAPASKSCGLQNLYYHYDAAGNITQIRDEAHQPIYFRNGRVDPSNEYTYDSTYRLIRATGREHLGQGPGSPIPYSHNDAPRVGLEWSENDSTAMGTYKESYFYDEVGNFKEMKHHSDVASRSWSRGYKCEEDSLTEPAAAGRPAKTGNRLSSTSLGGGISETYTYDAHGNVTRMPHLGDGSPAPSMHWDFRDQLCQADLGGGGTAFFVYDAAGQRTRKVWKKSPGETVERIYLGGFEIFRRHDSTGSTTLERETLHVMDDKQRITLVETRTKGNDAAPRQFVRYQFGNHLGSAVLELDDLAQIISYEEYAPYGSTTYQAVRTETPRRYRYTGKERDEETGLTYHEARYYAPWLGRWTAPDPADLIDGCNAYWYVKGTPIQRFDPRGTESLEPVRTPAYDDTKDGVTYQRYAFVGTDLYGEVVVMPPLQVSAESTPALSAVKPSAIPATADSGEQSAETGGYPFGEPAGMIPINQRKDPGSEGLVRVDNFGSESDKGTYRLSPETAAAFSAMRAAALKSGVQLKIGDAYRTREQQADRIRASLKKYSTPEEARKWVAQDPEKSEHRTGRAIDMVLGGLGTNSENVPAIRKTKEYKWMREHAGHFGFNEYRLPDGTGEPWHWSFNVKKQKNP